MLGCVPISTYCHDNRISKRTIESRLQRGTWQMGTQVKKTPGVRERWVDLDEVSKWAKNNSASYQRA